MVTIVISFKNLKLIHALVYLSVHLLMQMEAIANILMWHLVQQLDLRTEQTSRKNVLAIMMHLLLNLSTIQVILEWFCTKTICFLTHWLIRASIFLCEYKISQLSRLRDNTKNNKQTCLFRRWETLRL